jgi:cytochrome c oxidase subunit 2
VGVSRDRARRVGLRGAMALSGVALTLLAGCSADTTAQLKRLGLPEQGTVQASAIGDLWIGTWIAAGVIGVAVWGIIGWVALRYRSNNNDMPKQNRYNLPMEIFYTVAPFVVIGVLFYYTVLAQNVVQKNPTPDLTVDVVGQKWAWTFNYESADNAAVGTDVWETGTINQWSTLYLPVNKTVRFNLSSPDVNHDFWVPVFYEKMDVVPGRENHFTVTPNREGVFRGKCAELCGTYHSSMLFEVHVVSEADYEAHLKTLVSRGQTGKALGAAIPNPVGDVGNTDKPAPAPALQGGTR